MGKEGKGASQGTHGGLMGMDNEGEIDCGSVGGMRQGRTMGKKAGQL